jgi:hypothetical protein
MADVAVNESVSRILAVSMLKKRLHTSPHNNGVVIYQHGKLERLADVKVSSVADPSFASHAH